MTLEAPCLGDRLREFAADPSRLPDAGLLTITLPLDRYTERFPPDLPAPFFVWAHPERRHLRIGLGIAWSLEVGGPNRFHRMEAALADLTRRRRHLCLGEPAPPPGIFCAFAFEDATAMSGPWAGLPANLLAIPEVLLEVREGRCTLSLTGEAGPETDAQAWIAARIDAWQRQVDRLFAHPSGSPDPDQLRRLPGETPTHWRRRVEDARGEIAAGHLAKVVLAREVRIAGNRPFRYAAILDRLAQRYPGCRLIGLGLGEQALIAATPERLAVLREGIAQCDALGGTSPRGADREHDGRCARQLLHDAKNRHEHALVVEQVVRTLRDLAIEVSIPEVPTLMPVGSLYHLWSPVVGRCPPGISLLSIAARLHPTPAVAGMPSAPAKAWLARNEPFDRGWYTGGIGWLEANGDGELSVLLRCALLTGCQANLYAGAGIVAASDPEAEFNETELKLGAIVGALTADPAEETDRLPAMSSAALA